MKEYNEDDLVDTISFALLMQASSWPLLLGLFTGTWTKIKSQICFADEIFQRMAKPEIKLDDLPM